MAALELYYTSLFADANLTAYYRFVTGQLTTDSTTNARTLTNSTGVAETASGKFGYAADFGTSDAGRELVRTGDAYGITDQNAWSISLWAKSTQALADEEQDYLVSFVNNGYGTFFLRFYKPTAGSTQIDLVRNNGLTQQSDTASPTPTLTDWNHYVVTVSTTTMHLYVNGTDQGATTCSGVQNGTTTYLRIGSVSGGGYFDGYIDDVAVFNDVLSSTEVSKLYDGTIDKYYHESYSDTFTSSESLAKAMGFNKALSDSFTSSDSSSNVHGIGRSQALSDTFSLSESLAHFHGIWTRTSDVSTTWTQTSDSSTSWSQTSGTSTTWTKVEPFNEG